MDLDEWELIPNTKLSYKEFGHVSKELLFVSPELLVKADYFKCPTQREEEPTEFKDIGVSPEFRKETTASPAMNWLEPDPILFERGTDKNNDKEEALDEAIQLEEKKELELELELVEECCDKGKDCVGFNLWGLRVNGISAICSFGVATAATLCVFALGSVSASASGSGRVRPNPNIQFQIYTDDKRIKDVAQRATGLKHAMSAARGITLPRAQITFGGHYEGP